MPDETQPDIRSLIDALDIYRDARLELLKALGKPDARSDPLAVFSEAFVRAIVGGELASSPVQAGWDVIDADQRKVQVRYLANPADRWVNEHRVDVAADLDDYGLVLIEAFEPIGVVVFPKERLAEACDELGKKHPLKETQLQFTRANWIRIREDPDRFEAIGVRVYLPPSWSRHTG